MPDDAVRLRPIEEADLNPLSRLDTDPAASQPFEWMGFRDPRARRRRWEQDGWIGRDSTQLAVALPDGTLAGIVSWRTVKAGGPEGSCWRSAPCCSRSIAAKALARRRSGCSSSTCSSRRWPTGSRRSPTWRTWSSSTCWSGSGSAARA
jgi:hypothetical protein